MKSPPPGALCKLQTVTRTNWDKQCSIQPIGGGVVFTIIPTVGVRKPTSQIRCVVRE